MEKSGFTEQKAYIYAKGLCEIAKMESGGSLAGKRVALIAKEPLLTPLKEKLVELYSLPVHGEGINNGERLNCVIIADEALEDDFLSFLAPEAVIIDAVKGEKGRFKSFDNSGAFKRIRVLNIGE